MTKARKFKKRLAPKPTRHKTEEVLSVELIRKETLQKISGFWKKIISRFKGLKLVS